MRFPRSTTFTYIGILIFALFSACSNPEQSKTKAKDDMGSLSEAAFVKEILRLDTLRGESAIMFLDSMLKEVSSSSKELNTQYQYYLKGSKQSSLKNNDSANYYFEKMQPDTSMHQLQALKMLASYNRMLKQSEITPGELLDSVFKSIQYIEKHNIEYKYKLYEIIAQIYFYNNNIDASLEYLNKSLDVHPFKENRKIKLRYIGNTIAITSKAGGAIEIEKVLNKYKALLVPEIDSAEVLNLKQYELALVQSLSNPKKMLTLALEVLKDKEKNNEVSLGSLNNVGSSYAQNRKYDNAILYFKKAIKAADTLPASVFLERSYDGLSNAYFAKGDFKNAYIALDSLRSLQLYNTNKISAEKMAESLAKYESEKKDAQIVQLESTNILNGKIITQQRWFLWSGILVFLSILLFLYTNNRRRLLKAKNEKLAVEIQKLKLEQQIRQIQLNPHFIYNTITNLQGLIISDKKKEANKYLVDFSRLIRNILEQNRREYISVLEEISSLEHYMKLQQMRFSNSFIYEIDNRLEEADTVLIPPMLLQPFVENAIEHGLQNLDYEGKLHLVFEKQNGMLHIQVLDNGVGSNVSKIKNVDKQSLSQIITQERLDVLYNQSSKQAWFTTASINHEGTSGFEVNLFIPFKNDF